MLDMTEFIIISLLSISEYSRRRSHSLKQVVHSCFFTLWFTCSI